ncbi:hypothetical protein Krac_4728 [Ktedonobacter racemifer DSM 44963]|uniref:Uncharacterized protein n=1 Tax=Ktedonobacter racemifer DSM 44963 TaxID=485913 RepID=D6TTI2_KTERA|nr:hypothetical protein Krac_4728 [Ktedonobacter racemifer DSM 44963]
MADTGIRKEASTYKGTILTARSVPPYISAYFPYHYM